MFYQDLDYRLGKEHVGQMRGEIERNRLAARLAATGSDEGGGTGTTAPRKGPAARGAAVVMALFR